VEAILGFQQRGERLFMEPCIPAEWKEFAVEYRYRSATYSITVQNPDALQRGRTELTVDGNSVDGGIPLADDGKTHTVTALLRPSSPDPSPASLAPSQPAKARL
jgi:cellobiose phosphorylase